MTLTLDIPLDTEIYKVLKAAIALYDARLLTQGQAAEMTGLSQAEFIAALEQAGIPISQYDSAEELLAELGMASQNEHTANQEAPAQQQGSAEWLSRLQSTFRSTRTLTDEQTRRESFYGDDLR